MRRLRVLVLMHKDLVPPAPLNGHDPSRADWKTEYDVVTTLRKLGHEVRPLGVKSDLGVIRTAVDEWRPHIAFNLLENSMASPSMTRTWCRTSSCCACPIQDATLAG